MLTPQQIKEIKPQDRFNLKYRGKVYKYVAMNTPNGIVLVHDGKIPIKPQMGALNIKQAMDHDFIKTEE